MAEPRLDIALATWNGARWLDAQLASLARQSLPARVVVGDDGSDDGSLDVVAAWREGLPGGLLVLPVSARLGPAANFSRILAACDADWVACCDQDDVWSDDHLAVLLAAGRAAATSAPTLVVGDLAVVDADLAPLHPSFRGLQGFDGVEAARLRCLAVMNCFPGCAMLANRALLQAALPVPGEAGMHDWWLALCAAALGRVVPVGASVGRYRQHAGNSIGARAFRPWLGAFAGRPGRVTTAAGVQAAAQQAGALLQRHRATLAPAAAALLGATAALAGAGWLRRRWLIARHGLRRHPWPRQASMLGRG